MTNGERYFCISVRFLSPTYCGEEWPPSPARLFQALVAACNFGISKLYYEDLKEGFPLLEKPPELIVSCDWENSETCGRSFPSNQFEMALHEIGKLGYYPLGCHPSYRSLPRESKIPKDFYEPRAFAPRLLRGDRTVHYIWKIFPEKEEKARKVQEICKRMVALGWGTDAVLCEGRTISGEDLSKLGGIRYVLEPGSPWGKKLSVPTEGFLERVNNCFELKWSRKGRETIRPITETSLYRCELEVVGVFRQWVGFSLCDPIDSETLKAFSPHRWAEIVGWLRNAAERVFMEKRREEWVNRYILGHPEESEHLHFVPVPSVGHPFSDGFIRRALVCWSPAIDLTKEEVSTLEDADLVSIKGEKVARLRLERKFFDEKFIKPSRKWESVSPVILHGHDFRRGKFSPRKAQLLILQAFQRSGYEPSLIESLSLQKAPIVPGTLHVSCYQTPRHLNNWSRYHVQVVFKKPVGGPLLVGKGRFYGFGLFMSQDESEWK